MASHPYQVFDPLLGEARAAEMVALCERFAPYGMYSEEALNEGIGEGLPQRFDAAFNYVRTGGRFGRREEAGELAARSNYFRETYAYGEEVFAPGIEPFLHHEGMIEGARALFGRPVVEPAIVFANLFVPGQELATHTDVPEFRGAGRKHFPQWLLVVMHHSGLFESWRMPIATAVSWYHDAHGGAFAFYPDGAGAPPNVHEVAFDTAVLTDTDSVFHGVDQVGEGALPAPALAPGMRLAHASGSRWCVVDGGDVVDEYDWAQMRFSVSWKAYCFEDEAERRVWADHRDDLAIDGVLDTLVGDLRERGRIEGERPTLRELALLLVDEYIRFPEAVAPEDRHDTTTARRDA